MWLMPITNAYYGSKPRAPWPVWCSWWVSDTGCAEFRIDIKLWGLCRVTDLKDDPWAMDFRTRMFPASRHEYPFLKRHLWGAWWWCDWRFLLWHKHAIRAEAKPWRYAPWKKDESPKILCAVGSRLATRDPEAVIQALKHRFLLQWRFANSKSELWNDMDETNPGLHGIDGIEWRVKSAPIASMNLGTGTIEWHDKPNVP